MMVLADLTEMVSYIMGAFAMGYSSSWLFYVFRRVAWGVT